LNKDVIFNLLQNQRRRCALRYLRENLETTLSDLAEHVAALENDKEVVDLNSSERKCVYVGFYQCHLPKMADVGLIDYQRDRGTIELRETAAQLFPYMDLDPDEGGTGSGRISRFFSAFVPTRVR